MPKGGSQKRETIEERNFQPTVIKELKKRFEGCHIEKLDARRTQGIPDLLILYGNQWATLEMKRASKASHRPNQDYYVEKMNNMSFSRFISPENKESVLNELEKFFKS